MPISIGQQEWLQGVISGLIALSDNRWMMPASHLRVILEELALVIERNIPGAVVEMGCAGGRTSMKIGAFLQLLGEGPGRPLHLYDSFVGFPPLTPKDDPGYKLDEGLEILKYPREGIPHLFTQWGDGLAVPIIHKGFFREESTQDNPHPENIAFSLIDCDTHDSIKTSLNIVWPRLSSGGTIIVHDYCNPSWPGAKLAVDTFFKDTENDITVERCVIRHNAILVVTKL